MTAVIVVFQTVIGLLGFVTAGTAVKRIVKGSTKPIVKGSTKRNALRAIWRILIHGAM